MYILQIYIYIYIYIILFMSIEVGSYVVSRGFKPEPFKRPRRSAPRAPGGAPCRRAGTRQPGEKQWEAMRKSRV